MNGPLDGVKVVEMSLFQQGPVAGMRLGDLGADVIKIEPRNGDPGRGFMRIIGSMQVISHSITGHMIPNKVAVVSLVKDVISLISSLSWWVHPQSVSTLWLCQIMVNIIKITFQ